MLMQFVGTGIDYSIVTIQDSSLTNISNQNELQETIYRYRHCIYII